MFYYIVIKYYSISYIWIFDSIKIGIDKLVNINDNYIIKFKEYLKWQFQINGSMRIFFAIGVLQGYESQNGEQSLNWWGWSRSQPIFLAISMHGMCASLAQCQSILKITEFV